LVPVTARLRAVSLVCKRWRAAALRSVRRLDRLPFATAARALALMPSVTAANLVGVACDCDVGVFTSLTELTMRQRDAFPWEEGAWYDRKAPLPVVALPPLLLKSRPSSP